MPNWNQLFDETRAAGSMYDVVRRRYLSRIHELTGRNVIVYSSGWLQRGNLPGVEINDDDKNGFMTVIHQMKPDIIENHGGIAFIKMAQPLLVSGTPTGKPEPSKTPVEQPEN